MKRFNILSFVFAIVLVAAAVYLTCIIQKGDHFTAGHIADGLFIGAALNIMYGCEFLHTYLVYNAANVGHPANAYQRIWTDMKVRNCSDRFFIPEYLIVGILSGLAGAVFLFLR